MTDVVSLEPVQPLELDVWREERRLAAIVEVARIIETAASPAEAAADVVEAMEDMGWAQGD